MLSFFKAHSIFRTIRGRMTFICIVSLIIPLLLSVVIYTRFIHRTLETKIGDELLSSLITQTALLDDAFAGIQEDTSKLLLDESLYELFQNDLVSLSGLEYYQADKLITQALNRYYYNRQDIYAAYLITPTYLFGHMRVFHTLDILRASEIYEEAIRSTGEGLWFPTFYYQDMFPMAEEYWSLLNYEPFFAYTKKVRFISQNQLGTNPSEDQLPIVLLYFQTGFFDQFYRNSEDYSADIWVMDSEKLIYTNNTQIEIPFGLEEISQMGEPYGQISAEDEETLLVYVRSEETDWMVVTSRSIPAMMKETYEMTQYMLIWIFLMAIVISGLILFVLKRMLKPLDMVTDAITQSGEGDFKFTLPEQKTKELQALATAYNDMNVKIDTLIDDLYRARLSETKTRLLSMQLQMEPHFLYNTLNAINWLAVDNNQEEISEMLQLLANMLRYTLSQENELVHLEKDMQWLNAYTRLLRLRFGNTIAFYFENISPELYETDVPVMFLQPFIENSVIHGINGYTTEGKITVRGRLEDNIRIFEIEDNGKGMNEDELRRLWEKNPLHLGIRNVDMRIKMIYGEEWGVAIDSRVGRTAVTIQMPLDKKIQDT